MCTLWKNKERKIQDVADYQDVQVAKQIRRLINGPDFAFINTLGFIFLVFMLFVMISEIFNVIF